MTHDVENSNPVSGKKMEDSLRRPASMSDVPGFEWKLLRKLQAHGHLTDYQLICQSKNGSENEYHLIPSYTLPP